MSAFYFAIAHRRTAASWTMWIYVQSNTDIWYFGIDTGIQNPQTPHSRR